MQTLTEVVGLLRTDVASEGKMIRKGSRVIAREVVDNCKNLSIEVRTIFCMVRLPFYGNSLTDLVLEADLLVADRLRNLV